MNSKTLDLSGLQLTALPDSIGKLTKLTSLDLSHNELTALPDTIGKLTELTSLNLSYNALTWVSEAIGKLTELTMLDLSCNELTALPHTIGHLTKLFDFSFDVNPDLSSPPPEVIFQGTQAVLAFLRELASSIELWQSKILIVGEATVGKTSLAKRLCGEPFDPDERQTHGVRVQPLRLVHPGRPEVEMALDMWDFGGQLEYRATQRFYLTDRSLFVLVWNSRARWPDGKITAWLDVITARAPRSPILIVATHGDEHSPATLPGDLAAAYPRIVGTCTVDSRTGSGIPQLRQAIAEHAAALPLMGQRWPATWDAAAKAVRDVPGLTASAQSVFQRMTAAGVGDLDIQRSIAGILHDLGQIVYFADSTDLAAKVILQPQWLDARITQVIDSKAVTDAGGVLSRIERHRLWDDLVAGEDDPDLPDRLLCMMERFDLAYRLGDAEDSPDVALIVDRLPETRPQEADRLWQRQADQPGIREIAIIYKLASRQAGIPGWFIAREHRYTTGIHWRHGVLLHDRDPDTPAWALLADDGREQPTITLQVIGAYPVRFLSVLTEAFDNIVEDRYPGLIEQRLIPCACQAHDGGRCTHAFTLEELIAEATAAEPDADHKVRCPKSRRKIDAAIMLDGLRGTGVVAELDALGRRIAAQTSTLTRIDAGQQAMLNGIRTLLEHRTNAGVTCPALFSIEPAGRTRVLHRQQIAITLWCEWPSSPHPLPDDAGRYILPKMPPALIAYLPYLRFLTATLGLVTPGLTTAGFTLNQRVTSGIDSAAKSLEHVEKHLDTKRSLQERGMPSSTPGLHHVASGADFRALRNMLRTLDPDDGWGGLSPASRPEDRRIIYLCREHLAELDYPYTDTARP